MNNNQQTSIEEMLKKNTQNSLFIIKQQESILIQKSLTPKSLTSSSYNSIMTFCTPEVEAMKYFNMAHELIFKLSAKIEGEFKNFKVHSPDQKLDIMKEIWSTVIRIMNDENNNPGHYYTINSNHKLKDVISEDWFKYTYGLWSIYFYVKSITTIQDLAIKYNISQDFDIELFISNIRDHCEKFTYPPLDELENRIKNLYILLKEPTNSEERREFIIEALIYDISAEIAQARVLFDEENDMILLMKKLEELLNPQEVTLEIELTDKIDISLVKNFIHQVYDNRGLLEYFLYNSLTNAKNQDKVRKLQKHYEQIQKNIKESSNQEHNDNEEIKEEIKEESSDEEQSNTINNAVFNKYEEENIKNSTNVTELEIALYKWQAFDEEEKTEQKMEEEIMLKMDIEEEIIKFKVYETEIEMQEEKKEEEYSNKYIYYLLMKAQQFVSNFIIGEVTKSDFTLSFEKSKNSQFIDEDSMLTLKTWIVNDGVMTYD